MAQIYLSRYINRFSFLCRSSFFCLILLSMSLLSYAQEKIELNLTKALELAGANNATINMLSMEEALSAAKYSVEKNWWIPELYAGLDLHQLWGNALNSDGRIFQDATQQSFSGALGIHALFDFKEGAKNKNLQKYQMESQSIKSIVARNEYILDVVRHYYHMVGAHLEAESYANLVTQNDSIITQLELLVGEGLQYNTDLLLARSSRENHLISFSSALRKLDHSQYQLVLLLDLREESKFSLGRSLLPLDLVKGDSEPSSIPQIDFLENQFDAKKYEYKIEKNGIWIPSIRFNAYTSLFGGIFEPIDPTHAINGGIGWNIPLRRLTGDDLRVIEIEKNMLDQEIQYQKSHLNHATRQLKNDLSLLQNQIQSSQLAISLSMEAMDETIERQKLGLARPFEIELTQKAFIRSRINYIQSVVDYNITQYELFVMLGNNL